MGSAANPERRRSTRHAITVTVEISRGSSFSLHACENLSIGGAFFRHAIPFEVGTVVDVRFQLPGEPDAIRCDGVVANVPNPGEFGMGVKFMGLTPSEEARIETFGEVAARAASNG